MFNLQRYAKTQKPKLKTRGGVNVRLARLRADPASDPP